MTFLPLMTLFSLMTTLLPMTSPFSMASLLEAKANTGTTDASSPFLKEHCSLLLQNWRILTTEYSSLCPEKATSTSALCFIGERVNFEQ